MQKALLAGAVTGVLLVGALVGVQAQSTSPDPTLQEVFATDQLATNRNTLGGNTYVQAAGLGVGFDPSATLFANANSASSAQSIFNTLVYRPENGAPSTLNGGDFFQIGVHGSGNPGASGPLTIYASVFQEVGDPNGTTVPLGSALQWQLTSGGPATQQIPIVINNATGDQIYFSSKVQLAAGSSIQAGQNYVLAFSPTLDGSSASPTDYATVERIAFSKTGQATGDQSIFANSYALDQNNGDNGGTWNSHYTASNSTVAYRFEWGQAAPVPEASTVVGMTTLVSLLGIGYKRRRTA